MEYSVLLGLVNVLLVLGLICYIFYWYQTKNFNYWKERRVPFIQPHWLFGSFKSSIMQSQSWPRFCKDLYNTYSGHRFVGTYTFRRPSMFVLDPTLIDKVLVQDFVCFEDRGVPHNPCEPLFSSPFYLRGQKWRDLRQRLLPSFTSLKLKDMFNQVYQSGENILHQIDLHKDNDGIDVEQLSFVYATEVIASCTFGIQLCSDSGIWNLFLRAVKLSNTISPWQTSKYLLSMMYPKLFQWFGIYLNDKTVTKFFTGLTKSTIKYREENNVERNDFLQSILDLKWKEEEEVNESFLKSDNASFVCKQGKDTGKLSEGSVTFSNKILHDFNRKKIIFSENCISSFMFSFIVLGVSLEVGTISFALFELAKNPSIQKKLQREVDALIRKNGTLNYEAIKDMTYLDQVLQETLRMYTLSPVLTRDVTAPYRLPDTDVTLEKGMFVLIPLAAIHKDPRYYPTPESFNPDRFINNNYKPSSVYLPFGHGPRMCLATKFAVVIMKVCIARIVSKYNVNFGRKLELPLILNENENVLKSDSGIWLSFELRTEKQ